MSCIVHESSIVGKTAQIGEGTRIWQFCIIMDEVTIGQKCNIGAYVFAEKGVQIGAQVKIKNNVSLYSGVKLEDDVFIGPNVVFTNVINPRSFIERKREFRPTIVRKGASVGANATIICGHEIGEYALIGAGSVVTKDVEPYALIMGNPGKPAGYVCRCGERLPEELVCKSCNKKYERLKIGGLRPISS